MYTYSDFFSQKAAEQTIMTQRADKRIIISITTPKKPGGGTNPANLYEPAWHDILRLEFHDAEPSRSVRAWRLYFSEAQAKEIIDFLKKHENSPTVIEAIVHCEAGISRSAAVMKFIAQTYNLPPLSESYTQYNRHVFTTLLKVHGQIPRDASESAFNLQS